MVERPDDPPQYIADHDVYAARANGEIVGFYALEDHGPTVLLEHLWVWPDRIGTGVGRTLFEHARRRATALGAEFLEIESEPNAAGFYRRMGAAPVAESVSELDGDQRVLPVLRLSLRGRAALPGTIKAGEVTLRRWRVDDVDALAASVATSLEHLTPWMPWAHEGYGRDDAALFVEISDDGWSDGSNFTYGIFLSDGTVIGSCGLHGRAGPDTLEVGYWLDVGHTGHGYATAATDALVAVALAAPGIERIALKHDAANAASGAIPDRLGFREVARIEREPQAPGETGVEVVWQYPVDPSVTPSPQRPRWSAAKRVGTAITRADPQSREGGQWAAPLRTSHRRENQ